MHRTGRPAAKFSSILEWTFRASFDKKDSLTRRAGVLGRKPNYINDISAHLNWAARRSGSLPVAGGQGGTLMAANQSGSPWWSPGRHADVRAFLAARGAITRAVRAWFEEQRFVEVETG